MLRVRELCNNVYFQSYLVTFADFLPHSLAAVTLEVSE